MLVDARTLDPDSEFQCGVCVVGAGAAGITAALALVERGHEVVLLESGGLAYEQAVQQLYVGEEEGTLIDAGSQYLGSTRLRYLGGTTNHWNGWVRPLDPIDFETRDWVPESGWPIDLDELAPYYRRAVDWVQVSPFDYRPEDWREASRPFLFAAGDPFETSFFHVSPPTRFGVAYRDRLEAAPGARLCLHANLVRLRVGESGRLVVAAEAATLDGRRLRVRARAFVLAAGTIENARLLLAAHDRGAVAPGNDHDLVGRYFQEHPFVRAGYMALPGRVGDMRAYRKAFRPYGRRHRVRGVLVASAEAQRRHRILNGLVVIDSLQRWELPELGPEVAELAALTAALEGPPGSEPPPPEATFFGSLTFALEQAPSASSRVRLADEVDALGLPRTRLEWPLSELDTDSLRRTARLLTAEISRVGGRARLDAAGADPWRGGRGSPHQMGTTRMDPDPRKGVVDTDARVHGVANLYVAGGSVFPTSGCSNPTLTLVALTLRLAGHLDRRLSR